jgi:sugar lactone lactonase YvrE/glycerophosphoryl diester phosphodiesterase
MSNKQHSKIRGSVMNRFMICSLVLSSGIAVATESPLIIAHRGASYEAPENTLAAFRLAFEKGADGVEGDFFLTRDGKLVCIHDKTTKRFAKQDLVVAKSTLEELKQLDVGSWKDPKFAAERIPTFDEVAAVIPRGKWLVIELKTGPKIVAPLKERLAVLPLQHEQCLIISFNADTIAEAKKQLPHIKAHWLSGHRQKETWSPSFDSIVKTLRRTKADGLGSQAKLERFNKQLIERLDNAGFSEFHVWTVNDPIVARHYRDLGAYGITTDRPGYVRKQLESKEELFVAKPVTQPGQFTDGIEGPACDRSGALFAVNFQKQGTVGRIGRSGRGEVFVTLPTGSVGNGIRFGAGGNFFVADYAKHNILRVDAKTKAISVHAHEPRMSQPNDLAISSNGILFASDPNWQDGTGQLWRVDRDGTTTKLATNMGTTNGIEVSPDNRTLYVNESKQRNIWAFAIEPDGSLSNKRLFRKFPDHGFDGMRCDVDGNLFVTRYGKGTVAVLSPEGKLLREIDLPGKRPSNLCFGGPDGRTVFVTEVENTQIVSFRTNRPGAAWSRFTSAAGTVLRSESR